MTVRSHPWSFIGQILDKSANRYGRCKPDPPEQAWFSAYKQLSAPLPQYCAAGVRMGSAN